MSKRRLVEERAMRDAALEIFKTDLTQIKADLKTKGVGGRIANRLGEGARDMAEDAAGAAEANYGKISALAAGVALIAFRNPILNFVKKYLDAGPTDDAAQELVMHDDIADETQAERPHEELPAK